MKWRELFKPAIERNKKKISEVDKLLLGNIASARITKDHNPNTYGIFYRQKQPLLNFEYWKSIKEKLAKTPGISADLLEELSNLINLRILNTTEFKQKLEEYIGAIYKDYSYKTCKEPESNKLFCNKIITSSTLEFFAIKESNQIDKEIRKLAESLSLALKDAEWKKIMKSIDDTLKQYYKPYTTEELKKIKIRQRLIHAMIIIAAIAILAAITAAIVTPMEEIMMIFLTTPILALPLLSIASFIIYYMICSIEENKNPIDIKLNYKNYNLEYILEKAYTKGYESFTEKIKSERVNLQKTQKANNVEQNLLDLSKCDSNQQTTKWTNSLNNYNQYTAPTL